MVPPPPKSTFQALLSESDIMIIKDPAYSRNVLCIGIVGTGFSSCSGELVKNDTASKICCILFSQKPLHRPDHSLRSRQKKACWNYGVLFLMQARNSSPFRPEALPHCSQKNLDCMPVAPTLPISSLSTRRQQPVRFGVSSISSIAARDV